MNDFLTVRQVSRLFKLRRHEVYYAIKMGRLPVVVMNGKKRIARTEALKWLEQNPAVQAYQQLTNKGGPHEFTD